MKLPDILKTKTLKFTAVTIVLGAIGSGVWEWLLKPALAGSTDFLLSVGTLGVKTFKDSVYADIARGLHEDASLRLLSLVLSAGPGFVTGLFVVLLVALHRVKAEKEALPSVSHRLLTGVSISMVVFLLAFSLIQTVRISYVNRAATHFNQLLNIAGPHLADSERILYRSRFAQIATGEDYASLVHSLDEVCRKNKLRTPEFDVW